MTKTMVYPGWGGGGPSETGGGGLIFIISNEPLQLLSRIFIV